MPSGVAGMDDQVMPVRYLMAPDKEAHISLSLIGGDTASAILRNELNVCGNPVSQVRRTLAWIDTAVSQIKARQGRP